MDNQQNNGIASTEGKQPAATQEQQKPKKVRRKTRLEKLAEAEQKLARAQAEVDRLKAQEEQLNAKMKIKMASWIIDILQGMMIPVEGTDKEIPALIDLMETIEEHGDKTMPKDLSAWIKSIA